MTAADPFAPARLGPLTLRNRFVKAATFEGLHRKGLVTDELVAFHRAVAAGGVGLSTVAYCAVSPEARSAPNELVMREEALPGLRRLTDAIHAEGAAAAAQLGHAGPVAAGLRTPALTPSRLFSPLAFRFTRAATAADLDAVVADFVAAARLAVRAGFDAIELHYGHHYLFSAFHSPRWNRRTDEWGGDVEGRSRLSRSVARAVREAVGSDVAVTAKLNMVDGVPGGLWIDEAVEIARLLEADGALDALQLTGGGSFANPMYLFRGDAPVREMAAVMRPPVSWGLRVFGRRFLKEYPYEEAYFLPYARQVRAAVAMPLVLLGGITRLDTVHAALAEGFDFVAMARALLRDPGHLHRLRADPHAESLCVHCNRCMPTIYRGTHCVLVPPEQRPGFTPA